ncbi:MAG: HAD-IC family P-type ATPase [Chloroflexi bacterium]|nr:HAD-IC family P-type ATPase [Chloroflexota bacterium]
MTAIRHFVKSKSETAGQMETGRSYWDILQSNLFTFFNIILFCVGIILLAFGRYNDAFITVSTGIVGTVVNAVQEIRAKRQLDKITLFIRPEVRVLRNGREEIIDAAQLVEGDTIHLCAGDQAMADGIVVGDGTIEVDESLLTGESDLVHKAQGDQIFSGSLCVNGDLTYRAEAVGAESFANKLIQAARAFTQVSTPLQQQVTLIIRLLTVLTVFMALIFISASFIHDLTFLQNVAASAVLIGLIPYGFFLTINLAYAIGAIKIAKAGAVVQHTNAVESLYYVDVLCIDKTGTLTTNTLHLQSVQPLGPLTETAVKHYLGDFAHSASATNTTTAAIRQGIEGCQRTPVDEVKFASVRKWSALSFADQADNSAQGGVFVLGALEMLQPYLVAETDQDALRQQTQALADQGLRTLLFAYNPTVTPLHNAEHIPVLPPLQPLGLIALSDELRPYARIMLDDFTKLGVRIKIISGDNPHTVAALAKQVGLLDAKLVSGPELAQMSAAEFEQVAEEATIFGRIAPEQKAQLIDALIKRKHYVAMIGDGVNDILALKKARLGIAMQSGSSAARNVADMVLLNDSYAALAPALTEGKRIINGLTNATYLLITRSFTYAFVIIGALMVGLTFPFEPAQAGITAITVGLPAFFLTLWARPNAKHEPLLSSMVRFVLPVALWSMLIGVSIYTFVYFRISSFLENQVIPPAVIMVFEHATGLTYQSAQQFGLTASRIVAQTALSVFLSLSALLLILFLEPPVSWLASWREVSPDKRPTWLVIGLIALLLVGLYIPPVSNYFGFMPPFAPTWGAILIGLLVWAVGLWLLWRKRWMDRLLAMDS